MPWGIPTLADLRRMVRDNIVAWLPGSDAAVPNSRVRVIGDAQALLARDNLDFIEWGTQQLLPDTAETEFLDRHASLWIDGRHPATYAQGEASFTGVEGTTIPLALRLAFEGAEFETLSAIVLGTGPTVAPIAAITAGIAGNVEPGESLSISEAVSGVDPKAVVVRLEGGVDIESDDELRSRVLFRIRQPPQGGAAHDFIAWAREVPGVTRAWVVAHEMGVGSVTVRFMMDTARAANGGFPFPEDEEVVAAHINTKRPVSVRDLWVLAPIPWPVDFAVAGLVPDTSTTRAAATQAVADMILASAAPAHSVGGLPVAQQTIYAAWINEALSSAPGVDRFTPVTADEVPPSSGHLAVPGVITFL